MKKTIYFPNYLIVVVLVAVSLSCSLSSKETKQNVIPTRTSIAPISAPTRKPETATNLPATETSDSKDVVLQWTIKLGKLRFIGVGSDGKVYGVGNDLYAIISNGGEILQTNEVSLGGCVRDNFSGGFGAIELNNWFVFESNGTFHTADSSYCVISPGNPPHVEEMTDTKFFPYADGIKSRDWPTRPEGFDVHGNLSYITGQKFDAYINKSDRKIAFVNRNGEYQIINLPTDLDVENHSREFAMWITPWDDVYCSYPAYDALGNNLGNKKCKFDRNGNFEILTVFPSPFFLENSTTNSASDMIFLPEIERVYLYSLSKQTLGVYDLDLALLEEYSLPEYFPGVRSIDEQLFVGYDGAVYIYDTEYLDESISTYVTALSKYLLP